MIRTRTKSRCGYLAEITGKSPKFASAVLACTFMASGTWVAAQAPADSNWKPLEDAMGRPGQVQSADVIRFGMPRKDLHVTLGDVTVNAGLALGSWTAFMRTGNGAMVMGDLVLTEDEVGPVMQKLQARGIEITAIHNHLVSESPHVVYMHIEGHGDAVKMAGAIHEALGLTKTPAPDSGTATPSSQPPFTFPLRRRSTRRTRKSKRGQGSLSFQKSAANDYNRQSEIDNRQLLRRLA